MLEDLGTLSLAVHYTRLGTILNLASRHFRAVGDDMTDNEVSEQGNKLAVRVSSKHGMSLFLDSHRLNSSRSEQ